MKKLWILRTGLLLTGLLLTTACTFTLETSRTELAPGMKDARRVYVSIEDGALDGGSQAFVNASFFAAVKQAVPKSTMVASGDDLSISLSMLGPVFQPRWYTILSLGLLREYYQLGSMRIVNRRTNEILAIHTVTITGRRVLPLGVDDYQAIVIPKLLELVTAELKGNGLAKNGSLLLDLSEG